MENEELQAIMAAEWDSPNPQGDAEYTAQSILGAWRTPSGSAARTRAEIRAEIDDFREIYVEPVRIALPALSGEEAEGIVRMREFCGYALPEVSGEAEEIVKRLCETALPFRSIVADLQHLRTLEGESDGA